MAGGIYLLGQWFQEQCPLTPDFSLFILDAAIAIGVVSMIKVGKRVVVEHQ